MTIKLAEAGTLTHGTGDRWKLLLISAGIGSSGSYSEDVLKAAAESKVFRAGTLSFIDHATEGQDWERPEGSIKDLAAVLTEDARWDDSLHGLVAEAKIFSHWLPTLESLKDDIGVSIRAAGEVEDTADGRVITKLVEARSVDFVTRAGRGGRVLEVLESERPSTLDEIAEIFRPPEPPGPTGKEPTPDSKENTMEISEADHKALTDKAGRADQLAADLAEAQAKIETFEAEKTRDARVKHVAGIVAEAFEHVDAPAMQALVIERLAETDADDDKILREARTYADDLKPKGTGQVHGLGESKPVIEGDTITESGLPSWDELAAVKGA